MEGGKVRGRKRGLDADADLALALYPYVWLFAYPLANLPSDIIFLLD